MENELHRLTRYNAINDRGPSLVTRILPVCCLTTVVDSDWMWYGAVTVGTSRRTSFEVPSESTLNTVYNSAVVG